MADFYLDHGAYAGQGAYGLAAPTTFGVPQEGDGGGTAAATAAPVAEVTLTANTTAAEQLVIAGATITAGASQTTNVFARGGSIAATVANIVALLNSSSATATVSTSVAVSVGNNANQLRNMVYAQVKSGDSSTVQIMFRVGSTALNHANNSAVAISSAGGWSSAPTVVQFAGGTSGCFGYLAYPGVCGQGSSIAQYRYGVLVEKPHVVKSGSASTYQLTEADRVWCRSHTGRTVTMPYIDSATAGRSSTAGHLTMVVDSATKWPGDSGTGIVRYEVTASAGGFYNVIMINGATASVNLSAVLKHALQIGFVGAFNNGGAPISTAKFAPCGGASATTRLKNVRLFNEASGTGWPILGNYGAGPYGLFVAEDCVLDHTVSRATSGGYLIAPHGYGGSYQFAMQLLNFDIQFAYTGVSPPSIFSPISSSAAFIKWLGGRASGPSVDFPLFSAGSALAFPSSIIVDAVSGVEFPTAYIGIQLAPTNGTHSADTGVVSVRMNKAGFPFRTEDLSSVADWVPSAAPPFPTLAAQTPDGLPMTLRMLWFNNSSVTMSRGARLPALTQVWKVSPAAVANVTLHVFVPTGLTFDAANLAATMIYLDDGGVARSVSVTGADLVASGATWTNAGSYAGYTAKELVFSTGANKIATNSEVSILFAVFGRPSTAQNEYLYVDPAFAA